MNTENIKEVSSFQDHVRKRPYMYFGGNDVSEILKKLMLDCINLCSTDEIQFCITNHGINEFTFGAYSPHKIYTFIDTLNSESFQYENNAPLLLKFISSKLKINKKNNSNFEINFVLDETVLFDTNFDYVKLFNKAMQVTLLNRKTEIITVDKRQKYLNQNYFHYPQGIFYLFERTIDATLGHPKIKITFDGTFGNNHYQIALAYRTDWFPEPCIVSYANDYQNIEGGSLVDGVQAGFLDACKKYVNIHNLTNYKISEEKLKNGLIIVCAVRGKDFMYGGSFRETLQDNLVKEQAKAIMADLAFDFFENNKEKVDKFFFRFDNTQFMSGMF